MGVSIFPAASSAGLQPKYQKFTSSGTFTLPTGYGAGKPLLVDIEVIGGGGGGGFTGTANGIGTSGVVNYFGQNFSGALNGVTVTGSTGGSGGYARSKAYLTSNLTIQLALLVLEQARCLEILLGHQINSHFLLKLLQVIKALKQLVLEVYQLLET